MTVENMTAILSKAGDVEEIITTKYNELYTRYTKLPTSVIVYIDRAMNHGILNRNEKYFKSISPEGLKYVTDVEQFHDYVRNLHYWTGTKHTNKKQLGIGTLRNVLNSIKKTHYDSDADMLHWFKKYSLTGVLTIAAKTNPNKRSVKKVTLNANEHLAIVQKVFDIAKTNKGLALFASAMISGRRINELKAENFIPVEVATTSEEIKVVYGITADQANKYTWFRFTGQSKQNKNPDKQVNNFLMPLLTKVDHADFIKVLENNDIAITGYNKANGYDADFYDESKGGLRHMRYIADQIATALGMNLQKIHILRSYYASIMGESLLNDHKNSMLPVLYTRGDQIATRLLGHSSSFSVQAYDKISVSYDETPFSEELVAQKIKEYYDGKQVVSNIDKKYIARNCTPELIGFYKLLDPELNVDDLTTDPARLREYVSDFKEKVISRTGLTPTVLMKMDDDTTRVYELAVSLYKNHPQISTYKRKLKLRDIVATVKGVKQIGE